MKANKIMTTLMVIILTLSFIAFQPNISEGHEKSERSKSISIKGLEKKLSGSDEKLEKIDPIKINSNEKLVEKAENQGWEGNGTKNDPYIIENYEIDGSEVDYAIFIGNVSYHFVIRNCKLEYAKGERFTRYRGSGSGIKLLNTQNGKILNNSFELNSHGIYLHSSKNNIIKENNFLGCTTGIFLRESSDNIIRYNTVSYSTADNEPELKGSEIWTGGIILRGDSSNNNITLNQVEESDIGIGVRLSDGNFIYKNSLDNGNEEAFKMVLAGEESDKDSGTPISVRVGLIILGGMILFLALRKLRKMKIGNNN